MHPSPYVPIRLRIFAPVIFLNDCVVSVLSLCTRRRSSPSPTALFSDRDVGTSGRMEEGDGAAVELRPLHSRPTLRQTAAARRKLD